MLLCAGFRCCPALLVAPQPGLMPLAEVAAAAFKASHQARYTSCTVLDQHTKATAWTCVPAAAAVLAAAPQILHVWMFLPYQSSCHGYDLPTVHG